MAHTFATLLLVVSFCIAASNAARTNNRMMSSVFAPVADETMCGSMVEPQGYSCQEHKVTTEDGYVLSMQRMPKGSSGKEAYKPPVLLQHGLLTDGVSWLLNSPNESLAFILADNGFDVWIANTRGTKYSRGHIYLNPNELAYWEWSWDELAAYDLPACFQYVYDQTHQKMYYVGHSLGTLTLLAALSQEKLSNMLRSAALLSPIAYLGQMRSLLARSGAYIFLAEELYWAGLREFVPNGADASKLVEEICHEPGVNCSGFTNIVNSFTGPNCCVNSSKIDAFLEHAAQTTSTKNMIHLSQMVRQGSLAMYDYGNKVINTRIYGKAAPPVYDVTMIPRNLPLFFGCGEQDFLSDAKDVQDLLQRLEDHDRDELVVLKIQNYSHADFIFGDTANQLVYNPLINFFEKH